MQPTSMIAVSHAWPCDAALAIAACRCGARGFLDAQWLEDSTALDAALAKLEAHADATYGVRVRAESAALRHILDLPRPSGLASILLVEASEEQLNSLVPALTKHGVSVLVEATSVPQAAAAAKFAIEGLVLKGHESGGTIGHETAFILVQHWTQFAKKNGLAVPFWVQGGIGAVTAAACEAAGAAGVVLDAQLLLARESVLDDDARRNLTALDGSETRVLGYRLEMPLRVYDRPGSPNWARLTKAEDELASNAALSPTERQAEFRKLIIELLSSGTAFRLLGQDVAFAARLADKYVTVAGIIQSIAEESRRHLALAGRLKPLAEGSPLAEAHGTQYPLLQGPMTRVSDTAEFCLSVAEGGALPFLALALLRGEQVDKLMGETKALLGDKPWGAGLLGFLPPEIRKEQTREILKHKPPFALIAGGRPDQARELEEAGIPTFLHVPSPQLLAMFIKDGARRFIFEGRECGGHVGPRTSFVLWQSMADVLMSSFSGKVKPEDFSIIYAGGIHDETSAAMVSAIAAPLAERGVKIGGLMGTAYLFTEEAVAGGAIVPRFQQEAISARETILFETGPGHAIRCLRTPYYDLFDAERRRLEQQGRAHHEIVTALERMNIGRLRVASKGVDRIDRGGKRELAELPEAEQFERGMYMVGQVAAMHDRRTTIAELHRAVCEGGTELIEKVAPRDIEVVKTEEARPCDIAIVGMASHYPGSTDTLGYWENILDKKYTVTEVPESHWDWRVFYDADPLAKDKIVSKWGGFMGDIPVDPLRYGITPKSMDSIEPMQLLLLEAVRKGLDDAGYTQRPFDRDRTCAILGVGGGGSPLAVAYGFRSCLPLMDTVPAMPHKSNEIMQHIEDRLPEWTEDSFPGFLLNVAVGRVANRFNFGGSNYAIDAACASSLSAVHACIRELELGSADVAVAMGADTVMTPFAYMAFSKTHALSKQGRCRPFDAEADGIVLSEGIGVVILKRLADARRDGDKIYAVIKGIGSSSDGKEKGLTAPNAAGQLRALRRAYEKAGLSPANLELVEAHGTGTVAGDQTEAAALNAVLEEAGADPRSVALGSVKSMIGHTKCAAGVGGLIKAAMALHHKVLPPTLVETPSPRAKLEKSALYLNTEVRPWIHDPATPRTAGVSAFGFGGTNVHCVLQEDVGSFQEDLAPSRTHFPAELFLFRRASRADLVKVVDQVHEGLIKQAKPVLHELAASVWASASADASHPTLSIVAESLTDLADKLAAASNRLSGTDKAFEDPRGIYFAESPLDANAKTAFLYPGQGSQYTNMLADLGMNFPEVRQAFDAATASTSGMLEKPLSRFVYPPSVFNDAARDAQAEELARTDVAQVSLGAAAIGVTKLLKSLGVRPDMTAGHSYGEYAALWAAGAMSEADLLRLSYRRGMHIREAAAKMPGGMMAVTADAKTVSEVLGNMPGVTIANLNAPTQTVLSGSDEALERALETLQAKKIRGRKLAVSCAFHSPSVAPAADTLAEDLRSTRFTKPTCPVYSNMTASPYPTDSQALVGLLSEHLTHSVRFVEEIEAMYAAGARTFVEVGPQAVLSGLVRKILGDREHRVISTDTRGRSGLVQLAHTLGQLAAAGVAVDLAPLFKRRKTRTFALNRLEKETGEPVLPKSTWVVNGIRSKPLAAQEPRLLGQRPEVAALNAGRPIAKPKAIPGAKNEPAAKPIAAAQPKPAALTNGSHGASPKSAAQASTNGSHSASGQAPAASHGSPSPARPAVSQNVSPSSRPSAGAAGPQQPSKNPMSAHPTHPNPSAAAGAYGAGSSNGHPPAGYADEATQVMLGFQQVMAKFLETQQSVMLGYLGAPAPESSGQAQLPAALPQQHAAPALSHAANGSHGTNGSHAASRLPAAPQTNGSHVEQRVHAPAPQPEAKPASTAMTASAPAASAPAPAKANVPAKTQSAPVPAAAASAPAKMNREELADRLVTLVSERTGYPPEMLDVDLDLEADLGVDSIKRVEILGTLAEELNLGDGSAEMGAELELEKLTSIRTIGGILEHLDGVLLGKSEAAAVKELAPVAEPEPTSSPVMESTPEVDEVESEETGSPDVVEVQRGLVQLADCPMPAGLPLIPAGAVLITDDGRGLSTDLLDRLSDFGQPAVLIRNVDGAPLVESDGLFTGDLSEPEVVAELASRLRATLSGIGGLVHLAPLAEPVSDENWAERARRDTKSLYLLARELAEDLQAAGERGGAFLISATALGGGLGFGEGTVPESYRPGHGGIIGFMKCVGQEWDNVLVRNVDVDPSEHPADLVEQLWSELADPNGPLEVGYLGRRRVTWEPIPGPLDRSGLKGNLELKPGETVLVTGGARGITARIAIELAKRYKPRLVLVGRSPAPASDESAETAGIAEPAKIKGALIASFKAQGKPPAPAEIERAYRRLISDREIRANLQAMEAAGSQVEYHSLDVRDEVSFGGLLKQLAESGGLAGVIHGAGVIEDKLVKDKTPESFDRVFSTKVESARIIHQYLDPKRVRFVVFFASIASRYGNRGQSDYAAANEVLSKLASQLGRSWPCRVFAVAWGPWAEVGMVSDLAKHLTARGITLIDPKVGSRMLIDELAFGPREDYEVLIAGGAANLVRPQQSQTAEPVRV